MGEGGVRRMGEIGGKWPAALCMLTRQPPSPTTQPHHAAHRHEEGLDGGRQVARGAQVLVHLPALAELLLVWRRGEKGGRTAGENLAGGRQASRHDAGAGGGGAAASRARPAQITRRPLDAPNPHPLSLPAPLPSLLPPSLQRALSRLSNLEQTMTVRW